MINCETGKACGHCASCKLFLQGNHPDLIIIKPDGNFIKLKQIHGLQNQLNMKPAFASKRVVLIQHAERMNRESANAFLKTLEEPPLNTLIVLHCSDEDQLIETIVSRCQRIAFPIHSLKELRSLLKNKFALDDVKTDFVLHFSNGGLRKDFIQQVERLMWLYGITAEMLENLEREKMAEYCLQMDVFVKEDLQLYFIEFIQAWCRDLLLLKDQKPVEHLYFMDRKSQMDQVSERFSAEQLQRIFAIADETDTAIRRFASKNLALDAMLIKMRKVLTQEKMSRRAHG